MQYSTGSFTKVSATVSVFAFLCSASLAQAREFKTTEEINRALQSSVTLARAVHIALDKAPGYALSAELEDTTPLTAEIKIVTKGGVHKVLVDASHGKIINDDQSSIPVKALHYSRKADAIQTAKVPLLEAISIAENKTGGKVVKVTFTREDGIYVYNIESVQDRSYTDLKIDANTKEVISSDYKLVKS